MTGQQPPTLSICPECGASWEEGQTCQDAFHQLLFWENEDPRNGAAHHLMVLCYHLQHPSLYSAEGLAHAAGLLVDFVERGMTPEEVRRRNRDQVDSGRRAWKVTARAGSVGAYDPAIQWTATIQHVLASGIDHYLASVERWSRAVLSDLRASHALHD